VHGADAPRGDDGAIPCHPRIDGTLQGSVTLRGYTIPELIAVIGIIGIVTAIAAPRIARAADGAAVHSATTEVTSLLALARSAALARAERTALLFDSTAVRMQSGTTRPLARSLGELGVTLQSSRDSITYAPTGLGYGAANTTIVLRRGAAAETVWVSREGRVR
jgi:prepilin-type N-terminal cleavage/methylation domain-containing protein